MIASRKSHWPNYIFLYFSILYVSCRDKERLFYSRPDNPWLSAQITGGVWSGALTDIADSSPEPIREESTWRALTPVRNLQVGFLWRLGPLELTWIRTGISNHMPSKMWDKVTYPFPNFNGATVEVWEWKRNSITHFIIDIIIFSMLGLKLIHISKRGLMICITTLIWLKRKPPSQWQRSFHLKAVKFNWCNPTSVNCMRRCSWYVGDGTTAVIITHDSNVIWDPNHQKFHCLLKIVGGVSSEVRVSGPLYGCTTSDLYIPRLLFPRTNVMTSLCVVVFPDPAVVTTPSYEFDDAAPRVFLVFSKLRGIIPTGTN